MELKPFTNGLDNYELKIKNYDFIMIDGWYFCLLMRLRNIIFCISELD